LPFGFIQVACLAASTAALAEMQRPAWSVIGCNGTSVAAFLLGNPLCANFFNGGNLKVAY
jgi:hypothetical protein